MVCFLACFGSCKKHHRKRQQGGDQSREADEAAQSTEPTKQDEIEKPISAIAESKENDLDEEEQLLECCACASAKKKVTFDLNVKTCEKLVENEGEKEEEEEEEEESAKEEGDYANYPPPSPNHRHQNYSEYEDGTEDLEDKGGQATPTILVVQEESSESLFSLSIDSRKQVLEVENGDDKEEVTSSPMPPVKKKAETIIIGLNNIDLNDGRERRSQFVDSVLNPLQNLTQSGQCQWKTAVLETGTAAPKQHQKEEEEDKENIIGFCCYVEQQQQQSFKSSSAPKPKLIHHNHNHNKEFAVDTSLSSWLVEAETKTSYNNNNNNNNNTSAENSPSEPEEVNSSLKSYEQLGHSNSPRRSQSQSHDEKTPIIGTVGSYWSHTRQALDSHHIQALLANKS